jgi:hypothetical protein
MIVPMDNREELVGIARDDLPVVEFDVVRFRGRWRVFHAGKYSSPLDDRAAATASAVASAKERRAETAGRPGFSRKGVPAPLLNPSICPSCSCHEDGPFLPS